ncbi:MAG: hypothetical protein AMXMBFR12_05840 [Candidatus Babeliales bacterium]
MTEKKSLHNEFQFSLNQKQMSLLLASILAFSFFIFISGYFLGKKRAAEEFSYKADQDSLADHIYSSMCVLYETKDDSEDSEENEPDTEISENLENQKKSEEISPEAENLVTVQETSDPKYFAELAGFSSSTLAEGKNMLNRLKARGFDVKMIERVSQNSTGESCTWHQIITGSYSHKEDVQKIASEIARLEHIKEKNIKIYPRKMTA